MNSFKNTAPPEILIIASHVIGDVKIYQSLFLWKDFNIHPYL